MPEDFNEDNGLEMFYVYIISPIDLAKETSNNSFTSEEERGKIDEQLMENLHKGIKSYQEYLKILKIYLHNKRLQDSDLWKKSDATDLKYFKFGKIPKISLNLCFILCALLLIIPSILILGMHDNNSVIELSQNVLRMVVPGTLGMLGLVITSATFMVNFFKDNLKDYKLAREREDLKEKIKVVKTPEEIYKLTDDFIKSHDNALFDVFQASQISKNLNKLSGLLVIFVILSLVTFIITFIPFNFIGWLYFILLVCLSLLFLKILFTILLLIRIITNRLLFNEFFQKGNQE